MPNQARDVIAPRLGLFTTKAPTHDRQGAINVTVGRRKPETRTTDGSASLATQRDVTVGVISR
jgi:hypothetical protein